MKIGKEVEGRLQGVKTLFMDYTVNFFEAIEYLENVSGIGHVYISDPENSLNYDSIAKSFKDYYVTLDVTQVKYMCTYENISIMFQINKGSKSEIYSSVVNLRPYFDQIKIEKDKHVIVLPMSAAIHTFPDDFKGDIEI